MPILKIEKHEGMTTLVAPEKMPQYMYQEIRNYEFSSKEGWLKTRKGYKPIITTGITDLKDMVEFIDKNSSRQILLLDGTTLKEIPYSSGYGAVASISNDERLAGSTVNTFNPIEYNKEIRSGAGVNAATDRPIWYGYIPQRKRFKDNVTVAAGKYLEEQNYIDKLDELLSSPTLTEAISDVSGKGFTDTKNFIVCYSLVLDGYQRYFPDDVYAASFFMQSPSATQSSVTGSITVLSADEQKSKRITGIDVFIAVEDSAEFTTFDIERERFFFLERIDINNDGQVFLKKSGTLDSAAQKVTITGHAGWLTFRNAKIWMKDTTNTKEYKILSYTVVGADIDIFVDGAIGDTVPVNGAAEIEFFTRWENDGSDHKFVFFYDNHYKKTLREMYNFIGIPRGDEGISDFRYKFGAIAGRRLGCIGFPDENSSFFYYSVGYNYDVIPSSNIERLKKEPTALIAIADEGWIVFFKDSADIVTVFGNNNHRVQDSNINKGCVGNSAAVKSNDGRIFWMSYDQPYVLSGGSASPIGDHLKDYWDKLSESEKEACVAIYNSLANYIIFSFPTYTDSDFSNGICFVYDLNAVRFNKISAWWILHTDIQLKSRTIADDDHLLTGDSTKIYDWNNSSPTESMATLLSLTLLKRPLLIDKINLSRLSIDFDDSGSSNITGKIYVDGSSTPSLTLTIAESDKEKFVEYAGDTLQVDFSRASSTDSNTFKSAVIEWEAVDG